MKLNEIDFDLLSDKELIQICIKYELIKIQDIKLLTRKDILHIIKNGFIKNYKRTVKIKVLNLYPLIEGCPSQETFKKIKWDMELQDKLETLQNQQDNEDYLHQ